MEIHRTFEIQCTDHPLHVPCHPWPYKVSLSGGRATATFTLVFLNFQVPLNMSTPSTSQPTLPSLASRLSAVRAWLLESELYLGDQSIRGQVAWAQDGKSHKLVLKSSIRPVEELTAADESDFNKSPNPTLLPIPATLSVVVLLSDADFWMVADAGYRGPGKFNQSFADVKPSCSGGIPDIEPFKTDFAEVIANIHWLMDAVATRGFKQKKGLLTGPPDAPRLKVRHVLFEVRACFSTLYWMFIKQFLFTAKWRSVLEQRQR